MYSAQEEAKLNRFKRNELCQRATQKALETLANHFRISSDFSGKVYNSSIKIVVEVAKNEMNVTLKTPSRDYQGYYNLLYLARYIFFEENYPNVYGNDRVLLSNAVASLITTELINNFELIDPDREWQVDMDYSKNQNRWDGEDNGYEDFGITEIICTPVRNYIKQNRW